MMALRTPGPSLCMNCLHSGHCVSERTTALPMLQCDEHRVRAVATKVTAYRPSPVPFAPTGLCITCDHVQGCGLRSPEKIVLHCEHYE